MLESREKLNSTKIISSNRIFGRNKSNTRHNCSRRLFFLPFFWCEQIKIFWGVYNILRLNPLTKLEDNCTVRTPHICVGFLDWNNLTNPNWLLKSRRCETNKARESWWPLIQQTDKQISYYALSFFHVLGSFLFQIRTYRPLVYSYGAIRSVLQQI